MLKIAKNITIEKDGQRITLSDEELKQIVRQAMGQELELPQTIPVNPPMIEPPTITEQKVTAPKAKSSTKKQKAHKQQTASGDQQVHISEEKKSQIMSHVHSRMNEIPQTLSFLLEGISYVPNYLPFIRKMIEGEPGVSKVMNGKRVLYFKKRAVAQATPPAEQVAPAAPSSPASSNNQAVISSNEQPSTPAAATEAVEQAPPATKNNNIEIA